MPKAAVWTHRNGRVTPIRVMPDQDILNAINRLERLVSRTSTEIDTARWAWENFLSLSGDFDPFEKSPDVTLINLAKQALRSLTHEISRRRQTRRHAAPRRGPRFDLRPRHLRERRGPVAA